MVQVILQNNSLRTFCLLSRNWLTLSNNCGKGIKQFCSDTTTGPNDVNQLSFKEKIIRKHHWPPEQDAKMLQKKFPEPKKIVDDLFAPFKNVEENMLPAIERTHELGNKICVTKLKLKWPTSISVTGKHEDESTSTENAYLNACNLLWNMGLVQIPQFNEDPGRQSFTVDNVIKILEDLASMQTSVAGFQTSNFRVLNLLQNDDEDADIFWTSSIQVAWPVSFTVTSKSTCLSLAYYQSCVKTVMNFKALGYLDYKNQVKRGILLSLERYGDLPNSSAQCRDLTNPDFELFVDASKKGMGAYLISKEDDKIRWLADRWVENKIKFEPMSCSSSTEFYAFVTAFYTWKHKFINKKIIVYSDNELVINIINHGIYMLKRSFLKNNCCKLYLLLIKTCHQNNITVVGMHVPRLKNEAADHLSRIDVNTFKQMLPTASEKPKKSKKLWFRNWNLMRSQEHKKDSENSDKTDP